MLQILNSLHCHVAIFTPDIIKWVKQYAQRYFCPIRYDSASTGSTSGPKCTYNIGCITPHSCKMTLCKASSYNSKPSKLYMAWGRVGCRKAVSLLERSSWSWAPAWLQTKLLIPVTDPDCNIILRHIYSPFTPVTLDPKITHWNPIEPSSLFAYT